MPWPATRAPRGPHELSRGQDRSAFQSRLVSSGVANLRVSLLWTGTPRQLRPLAQRGLDNPCAGMATTNEKRDWAAEVAGVALGGHNLGARLVKRIASNNSASESN